tara:strand:- start:1207 stop:1557 length:351 start_codon:yes stop_codon:yes gene_type:complete
MKNLEQIRAASAISAANSGVNLLGNEGGENQAKKIPPMIINHGLLQYLAYAKAEGKGTAPYEICNFLAMHLENLKIVRNSRDTGQLLERLSESDSQVLKQATSEALAWFNYARRFL